MDLFKKVIDFFTASMRLVEAEKEIAYQKAWAAYWQIFAGINMAVYFKNSIGRGATYCNVAIYDLLDSLCTVVWEVLVQIGDSYRWKYPMGQTIRAFDFDITPIMPEGDYNRILNAPIGTVLARALNASKRGVIRKLDWEEAQVIANEKAVPSIVISEGIKHVAVTCPNFQWNPELTMWELLPYDSNKGPFTGNAGDTNAMMYMSDRRGFGSFDWRNAAYVFELRDRETGEFLSKTRIKC